MKKYASYAHLSRCTIGSWQGLIRGNRFDSSVENAITKVEESLGNFLYSSVDTHSVVYAVLLADFLFHKISFPENKSRRVRAIKNKLGVPRRRFNGQKWFKDRKSHIADVLRLLKYPLREEGENEVQVGPFTLTNPINLSADKVEMMERACTKALSLCTNSLAPNFTQALYGNVVLVEKLKRKNWYAWYSSSKDEITMKYMDRNESEFIKTFVHEIGHRYYKKVLSNDKKRLWFMYDRRCHRAQRINLNDWVGKPINLYAKTTRTRTSISSQPSGEPVTISHVFMDGVYIQVESSGDVIGPYREKYLKDHIKSITGIFPTQYATSDVEEHFCEALSYKAAGKLHPKSLEAFNSIIVDGAEYTPDGSNFKVKYEPEETAPQPGGLTQTQPPQRTQVERTLPTKQEQVRNCESLANKLNLGFKKGRKYGLFIYTNDAVGSTHAYMFIDYATGNLFVPKAKDAPNLKVNIGNITCDDSFLMMHIGFDRMSNLRPRWRTMNTITQPTREAAPTEIVDQTPEPTIPTTPEGNLDSIKDAARTLSQSLGLEFQEMRKFLRLIFTNTELGTRHSYLFINKQNGSIHPPKAHDAPKKNVALGSILEPNVLSKVNFDAMTQNDRNWRKKYRIKGR